MTRKSERILAKCDKLLAKYDKQDAIRIAINWATNECSVSDAAKEIYFSAELARQGYKVVRIPK